uniref:Sodium:proton antiporter n=2 Tax=Bursaphelenchus xylophilus TaxID=6326 RepID=A0A1I7SNH9_BURXY
MDSFGGFNFKVVVALAIAWILTALVLLKGVKMMGKIAPYSATIPYVIIVMLFIRGVTLDGAKIGMDYYILKPNMTVIYDPE